jgi:hypothetical protein
LVPDEVDISLSLVLSKHHNLPIGLLKANIGGYLRSGLDGWLFQLLDENSHWNLCMGGSQLG